MCSCGHGVSTAVTMASSSSLRLRSCLMPSCAIIPPSLLLPSRTLHPTNAGVARCSWSRVSFATLREDMTINRQQLQQESSSLNSEQQPNSILVSENLNGASRALGGERPRALANGTLNGNSSSGRELVEEFLFTQDYLESLDYDSVIDSSRRMTNSSSLRRKIWVKVDSSSAMRLRPKLGSSVIANAGKRERKGGRVLPASIAEVLPLKPETSFKFYIDLYASLLRVGRIEDCLVLLREVDKVGNLGSMKVNHSRFYEACRTRGSVEDAFTFVKLMRPYSTLHHYTMLLSVCCHANDIDGALRVLGLLENSGLKADCMFYTTLISACSKAGKVDPLFKIYHEMELHGIETNVHTFGAMIDGCARAGQLPGVYGIMMPKISTRLSGLLRSSSREAVCRDLLTVCCGSHSRSRRLCSTRPSLGVVETSSEEKAKSKSREKPRRGGGAGGRQRLRARGKSGVAKEASNTSHTPKLEWLKQEGIDLTDECILDQDELCSRSATGLLKLQQTIWRINRSISRCSSLAEALEVVNEMKAAGIDAANEGTYLALITVCRRQQEGEMALSIYEAMKEVGVKPGVITYNTVISCCQQAKRLEDAFRIKREMEAAGVKPDVVTYTALMALVVKTCPYRGRSSPTQRLEKALQLYQEMLDRNIRPDSITYNTLMFAGAQAKMPGKVLEVYRTMVAAGVPPDQFTFGFILESAGAGGRLKVALEIFEEMRAAGIAPKSNTYNFLIEACASAPTPNAEKAWALYEEMKTVEDVVPNAQTYNHLISASCKGGDNAGALKAYELMQESGYQRAVTSATFNKLIQSASQTKGLESALEMYRKMLDLGYKPDAITYSTLVVACTREDNLNQALLVSHEMEGLGVKRNQVVQHAIIAAFGQAGQWEDAVATFRVLQEGEEQLTSVSYSIIFDACFGKGGAEAVLKQTKAGKLEVSPGIEAAIGLYEEAAEVGFFTNFTQTDLARCDVRTMSISGTVVAILAWLLCIGENPPASDILIITGVRKTVVAGKPRKVRYTKNHTVALSTLKASGLPCKPLDTATMQALTVSGAEIQQWLEESQGESVAEERN